MGSGYGKVVGFWQSFGLFKTFLIFCVIQLNFLVEFGFFELFWGEIEQIFVITNGHLKSDFDFSSI